MPRRAQSCAAGTATIARSSISSPGAPREELTRPPASDAVVRLRSLARERHITLLTATHDVEHSGARVLRDHLVAHGR